MSVLLVTYDLKKPGRDYTDLLTTIKSYSWAMLSESSYAIRTDRTPEQVYNLLANHLDENDHIYVVNLKAPFWGYGPEVVNEWLAENLSY